MAKINDLKTEFDDVANDKPVEVDLGGRVLELDVSVDDLHPIMTMGNMENPSEEDVEMLTETLRRILYRSYLPYWDGVRDEPMDNLSSEQEDENEEARQIVERLLLQNYLDIFVGIMDDLGWADSGAVSDNPSVTDGDFPVDR